MDGPGGVMAPFIPVAAIRSSEAIHEAGATAYGQFGVDPLDRPQPGLRVGRSEGISAILEMFICYGLSAAQRIIWARR